MQTRQNKTGIPKPDKVEEDANYSSHTPNVYTSAKCLQLKAHNSYRVQQKLERSPLIQALFGKQKNHCYSDLHKKPLLKKNKPKGRQRVSGNATLTYRLTTKRTTKGQQKGRSNKSRSQQQWSGDLHNSIRTRCQMCRLLHGRHTRGASLCTQKDCRFQEQLL